MTDRVDDYGSATGALAGRVPSGGGSAWESSSVIVLLGGLAKPDYGNYSPDLACLETSVAAGSAKVKIVTVGNSSGPSIRCSNTSNGFTAYVAAGGIVLYKIVAGSPTQIGPTYSGTVSNNDDIEVTVDALNAFRIYQNGTLRLGPITDSFNSTATKAGIGFYSSSASARLKYFSFTGAGGGATQVTSDLSAAYSVRGFAQSDLSASYAVRGAVQASLSASYAVLGSVQASLSAAYSVRGFAQSDLSASYNVIGAVQTSLTAAYAVLGAVQANLSAAYSIRGSALADLAAAYSIRGKVQADLAGSYTVVATVQSDLAASYTIIGAVQSDLAAAYSVRGAVQSDLSASYEIQSAGVVVSDLSASYSVLGTVTSDLSASYAVRAPVSSDLAAEYVVRGAVAADLTADYRVLTPVVSDRAASWAVMGTVTKDLAAAWAVMGTVTKDLAASYSIYSSSGGGTGASAQEIADAVWQRVVESGLTAEQMLRIIMAPLAGKADGIGTTTERYFAQDGVTPRVTANFDAQSNRTSTTVNGAA